MPAKSKFSAEDIINAAFEIARSEGEENCSARAIAHRLKSSTMPIYSCLNSMRELEDAVIKKAVDVLIEYETRTRTGDVFLDMGIGYIMFAKNEKHLFRMLFLSEKRSDQGDSKKRFRQYILDALLKALTDFEPLEGFSEQERMGLIDRMWIFCHGLAMLLNNSVIEDVDEKQVAEMLLDVGIFIIQGERARAEIYSRSDVKRFLKLSGYEHLADRKGICFNLF
jgi:AcrR family transcriptional regulator